MILDEWHELMGSKRGSQTELCLSWLRQLRPQLQTWAISATTATSSRQRAMPWERHVSHS